MAQSVPPGDIQTQPGSKIVFNSPYDDKHTYHIKISNSSARRIGWAIKTTNMKRLGVDPACGVLDPKEATLAIKTTNMKRLGVDPACGVLDPKATCGRDRKRKKSEETVENEKKKKIGEIALSKSVDNRGGKCQSVISPPNQSGGLFVPQGTRSQARRSKVVDASGYPGGPVTSPPDQSGGLTVPQGTRSQARRSKVVDATGYPGGPVISPPDQSGGYLCSLENPVTSPPVQSGGTFRKQRDPVINLPVKRGKISRNKRVTVKTPPNLRGENVQNEHIKQKIKLNKGESEQQQTNPNPHTNIIPDSEEIPLFQTPSGWILRFSFPPPRYYQCTEYCERYFCNTYTNSPSFKAEADTRIDIVKHLKKAHKITVAVEFHCRSCKQFICERPTRYNYENDPMRLHLRQHNTEYIRAAKEGDYVCGICSFPHRSAHGLSEHLRACKRSKEGTLDFTQYNRTTRRFAPQQHSPAKSLSPTQGKSTKAQDINTNPCFSSDEETTRETPNKTQNQPLDLPPPGEGFECLYINEGREAWYTDEVIVWAIHKITDLHIIEPARWTVIRETGQSLALLIPELNDNPLTLIPICEQNHWKLLAIRSREGIRHAVFLDPFQPEFTPTHIKTPVENDLKVEWIRPNAFYNHVRKQNNDIDCGPIICIFALLTQQYWRRANTIELPSPSEIRAELQWAHIKEREQQATGTIQGLKPQLTPNPHTIPNTPPKEQMRSLLDLQINTPEQYKPPIKEPIDKEPLIEQFRQWMANHMNTYIRTGSKFNQLEWIAEKSGKATLQITRERVEQFEKLLERDMPPPQEEREMATQTGKTNKRKPPEPIDSSIEINMVKNYWRNKSQIIEAILGKDDPKCQIPLPKLHEFFMKASQSPTLSEKEINNICNKLPTLEMTNIDRPFTVEEVKYMMKKMPSDSAAGADGLTYENWQIIDPGCFLLRWIFEECRIHERIPEYWKTTKVVLIYKSGDPEDPSNWRPISLLPTIYKLYTALLNNRISKVDGLISPHQKGFQKANGTGSNIAMVHHLLHHAHITENDLSMVFLDLKNAFGSVPHQLILTALTNFGFPSKIITIIADIYKDNDVVITTPRGCTQPIPIKAGVKQGDPISPTLFNIAIEPLLRHHAQTSQGAKISTYRIPFLAYADDLILLNNDHHHLQRDLNNMVSIAAKINLVFNPRKCASYSLIEGRPTVRLGLTILNIPLQRVNKDNPYKYLGIPIGPSRPNYIELYETIKKKGEAIINSPLSPAQKMDALKVFIYPKMVYKLQHSYPKRDTEEEFAALMTKQLKRAARLPKEAATEYLYSPKDKGGLNFIGAADWARILQTSTLLQNLWADDTILKNTTQYMLCLHANVILGLKEIPLEVALNQIANNQNELTVIGDMPLSRLILTSQHHQRTLSKEKHRNSVGIFAEFRLQYSNDEISLVIRPQNSKTPITIEANTKGRNVEILTKIYKESIFNQWITNSYLTNIIRTATKDPISRFFLGRGPIYLDTIDQGYIHAARTRSLQLSGERPYSQKHHLELKNMYCERCQDIELTSGNPPQVNTLQHIQVLCKQNKPLMTLRHNSIVKLLVEAYKIGTKSSYLLTLDSVIPESESLQRPDIVLRQPTPTSAPHEIIIIDVTCPGEFDDTSLDKAHTNKITKYTHFLTTLNATHTNAAKLYTMVVSAQGCWRTENYETLKIMGIPQQIHKPLAQLMCKSAISWSRYIYHHSKAGPENHSPPPKPYSLTEFLRRNKHRRQNPNLK